MIVLIIQKDTLENNKVKSVLKITDVAPEIFLSNLQESHCFVCQLVAFTENKPQLFDKLIHLAAANKTNFGKDWYEFDHETLAKIITLFIESDKTVIDFTAINSIYGFSFQIFPVITKEVKIISNAPSNISNLSSNLSSNAPSISNVSSNASSSREIKKEKEELLTLIDNLQESEIPRRKKRK